MKAKANSPLNVAQQPSTDLDEHPEHPKSKLKILSISIRIQTNYHVF